MNTNAFDITIDIIYEQTITPALCDLFDPLEGCISLNSSYLRNIASETATRPADAQQIQTRACSSAQNIPSLPGTTDNVHNYS